MSRYQIIYTFHSGKTDRSLKFYNILDAIEVAQSIIDRGFATCTIEEVD